MANGDYTKTVYATGDVITATKLNNNENKTKELDTSIVGAVIYAYKNIGGSI